MVPYIDVNSVNFVVGIFVGVLMAWFAEGIGMLVKYLIDKLVERKRKK